MTNNNDSMTLIKETRDYPIYLGSKLFKTVRLNIEGPKDELDAYKDYPFESFTVDHITYFIDRRGNIEKVKFHGRDIDPETFYGAMFSEIFPSKSPQQMVQENYDAILATIKRLERLKAFEDFMKARKQFIS